MESGDLEPRVSEFRSEIRDFRKATTASFNALRQDLVDIRRDSTDLRSQFDNGFAGMRGRFDGLAAGQQQIVDLLQAIVTDNRRGGTAESL